jgi:hypothetical protein
MGDVVSDRPTGVCGRVRHLDREDIEYLHDNPDYFLNELADLTRTNRFIAIHFTTVFNELERAGMSRKKLRRIASERNEELRAAFISRMAQYDASELGFIDEVSKDEWTCGRQLRAITVIVKTVLCLKHERWGVVDCFLCIEYGVNLY